MKLIDIILEEVELSEDTKWDPVKVKKIIKKYKSVPDFYHDYPNVFQAITNRHLQRQFLGHLKKDVSYKTGKAVKVNGGVILILTPMSLVKRKDVLWNSLKFHLIHLVKTSVTKLENF